MLGAATWRRQLIFIKRLRTIGAAPCEYIKRFAHGWLRAAETFILQLAQRIAHAEFAIIGKSVPDWRSSQRKVPGIAISEDIAQGMSVHDGRQVGADDQLILF